MEILDVRAVRRVFGNPGLPGTRIIWMWINLFFFQGIGKGQNGIPE